MAKNTTSPTDDLITMLTSAEPVRANTRLAKVDIPDAIREQVKLLAETGDVLQLPVTDEDRFQVIRSIYIPAAADIGCSANVRRVYDHMRDVDNRTWIATYVSIGARKGRGASNGAADSTTTEGGSNPAYASTW